MTKWTCLLLLLVVFVALTELSEGRRHWRQRKRHRQHRDRRFGRRDQDRERHSNGRHFSMPGISRFRNTDNTGWYSTYGLELEDPFFSFDFSWGHHGEMGFKSWWTGPNVCERKTEKRTNSTESGDGFIRHFSRASRTCDESETAYRCKETSETLDGKIEVSFVQECCHGFSRKPGDFGCPAKLEMKNLLQTAQDMGLTRFVDIIKLLKLDKELEEGNFTVFAPVNDAYGLDSNLIESNKDIFINDQPHVIMISETGAQRAIEGLQEALLGHLVVGRVRTSDMEDEEVLKTASPEGSTIRINYFVIPNKVTTANCVPMESTDHMASNGILHTLKTAMGPVTKSVLDFVKSNPELTTLKTVLASANYVSKLDQEGTMTLLAPTNKAFEMMNPRLRERLLRGDAKCLESVLLNHLLPNVICTSALKGEAISLNHLQQNINMTKTEDDKIFANGAQVIQRDLMATNGVIHLIDAVLVPDGALDILEVLEKQGYTELLDLIDQAELTKTIDTAENLTLFAPTNEAIENLPDSLRSQLTSDPELLAEVLNFHVSPGLRECQKFHDNDVLPSLAGPGIRLNKYRTYLLYPHSPHDKPVNTAQCVPLAHKQIEACNGHVNVIEDVMLPPKGNVIDVLSLDKRFSTLLALIKKSGLADSLQEDGPFTLFAPNNEAFEKLDEEELEDVTEDEDKLQNLLKRHVFGNTLCCAGFFKGTWMRKPRVRTLAGNYETLDREYDGDLRVGDSQVVKCDLTATNGNVLEIDTVLMDKWPRWRSRFRSKSRSSYFNSLSERANRWWRGLDS